MQNKLQPGSCQLCKNLIAKQSAKPVQQSNKSWWSLEFMPASLQTQLLVPKIKCSKLTRRRSPDILGAASSMCKGLWYKMKTTLGYLINYGWQGAFQSGVGKLHSVLAAQRRSPTVRKLTHFEFYPKTDTFRVLSDEAFDHFWASLTCKEVGPDSRRKEDGPDSM